VSQLFDGEPAAYPVPIPSQQTDSGPSERHAHSGLGLAICARLAREQGARLRLVPTKVGTRVELLLPLAADAAAKVAT
jgi:signal transduction histidine kinase